MFAAVVEQLTDLDDSALDDRIRRLELTRRRVEAEFAAAVAVAAARKLHRTDGHHSMTGYLRATCNVSSAGAGRLRRLGRLVDTVPGAGQRLYDGRIGVQQADELARARSNPRCGAELAPMAPTLLDHAEFLCFDDFRVNVRHWEARADLDGAHRDRERSVANRTATVVALGEGIDIRMSGGDALTTEEIIAIHQAATELEFRRDVEVRREQFGDEAAAHPLPRTAGQRRHDAIVNLFRRATNCADDTPLTPTVSVVIDEATLRETAARHGMAPESAEDDAADQRLRRCETAGGLNVLPDDALRAALWGHVRRVLVDSAGVVTDAGRRRRLYTGVLRELVQLSARRCTFAGCTIPATVAQIDHLDEWATRDGPTSTANGAPGCGSHNRLKNSGYRTHRNRHGHTITYRPDGTPLVPAGRSRPVPGHPDLSYRVVPWPTDPAGDATPGLDSLDPDP